MRNLIIAFCILLSGVVNAQTADSTAALVDQYVQNGSDSIPVYKWNEFKKLLTSDNDTTYIVNFWATWCRPCVEELPEFEAINKEYQDQKVKVILVSLDMRTSWDRALTGFINNRNIQSRVVILYEVDANIWINSVDPSWSGAIPATYVFKNDRSVFHEGKMTKDEIIALINEVQD